MKSLRRSWQLIGEPNLRQTRSNQLNFLSSLIRTAPSFQNHTSTAPRTAKSDGDVRAQDVSIALRSEYWILPVLRIWMHLYFWAPKSLIRKQKFSKHFITSENYRSDFMIEWLIFFPCYHNSLISKSVINNYNEHSLVCLPSMHRQIREYLCRAQKDYFFNELGLVINYSIYTDL